MYGVREGIFESVISEIYQKEKEINFAFAL